MLCAPRWAGVGDGRRAPRPGEGSERAAGEGLRRPWVWEMGTYLAVMDPEALRELPPRRAQSRLGRII